MLLSNKGIQRKFIICTTQIFAVWLPDDESNPDPESGSGHWGTRTVRICKEEKDLCAGIVNEFGQCEGSGSGEDDDDPGYEYPGEDQEEPTQLPDPKDPCEKIRRVGKNSVTTNAMKNLKTKVTDNKEHIYLLWEDNAGQLQNDIYGTGPVNGDGVDFNFNSGDQFSAFLHSHYNRPDMLSTFSFEDFITVCKLAYFNAIKDQDSFVMGVVTASGTQYMMIIDDPNKLFNFASMFFQNGVYNENIGDTYKDFYNDSVTPLNSIEKNEGGLVFFLEAQNIGLKLMKGDDQMESWQYFTKNSQGNIVPENCN